jgi:putative membrane protein
MPPRSIYPMGLLGGFTAVFVSLGIAPRFREDWLLENLLVFAAVAVLIATYRRWHLSNASYTLIWVFLVLHEIGAHYTYSLVPYDAWFSTLTGTPVGEWFGWQRNHYDRLIHFAYGLLILPPCAELLSRVTCAKGMWRFVVPVSFILAQSAIYELIEWMAAVVFGGELGTAYVGTQGDEWDAQKDMAFAASGAVLASASLAAWNRTGDLRWRGSGTLRQLDPVIARQMQ